MVCSARNRLLSDVLCHCIELFFINSQFFIYLSGIFLENNFKYLNAHINELGEAISANYRGFFSISCLVFDILRGGGNGPLIFGSRGHF